ncbi:MAG TPA: hypothetical protein VHM31_06285 [Polyangia bacterium]|nr:hypothetical protein [Polyangia bacterium]
MTALTSHRWFRNAAGLAAACAAGVLGGVARGAEAVAPEATAVTVAPPSTTPPTPPPPYSIPWQLRPAAAASVVRSDSSVAFYDNAGASGSTVATMLLGSYAVTPHLAPLVRLGFVQNQAPGTAPDGSSFINPIVGLTYARRVGSLRWAAFAGGTIPVGAGSGDHPDAGVAAANTAGLQARSGMDNAMFAVNYFTGIVGGDLAYVDHRLTVQVEATLFQLLRVHGDDAGSGSTDAVAHQLHHGPARRVLPAAVSLGRRRAALPALAVDADPDRDGREGRHPLGEQGHDDDRDRSPRPLRRRSRHVPAAGNLLRAGAGRAPVEHVLQRGAGRRPAGLLNCEQRVVAPGLALEVPSYAPPRAR